ncbi:MAG: alpha/beta hydrolase, partial [Acidobacteria bacterium]|nr:alpha/beta hydrolase [Acidobacteriota bacterium]
FPHRLAAATGAAVFVYSRSGHGNSPRLDQPRTVGYMHHEAEAELPALLREEGIERPVLFGHSDGASIALIHAARFPTAALILEAPHVFVEDLTIASIAKVKTTYQTTDLPQRLGRHHAHADTMFWGWNDIWLHPDFRTWNIEACLGRITCPVLVIQGEDDEFGTLAQIEAIRAKIPSAQTLILPDCGHAPHRAHPESTLTTAVEFITRLTGQGTHHGVPRF